MPIEEIATPVALAVPSPVTPSAIALYKADATASPGNSLVHESVPAGDSDWAAKIRRNSTRTDMLARYGAGGYGVATGLTLSASPSSGLTLSIAAGVAIVDGHVEAVATTRTLTDNIGNIWLWIDQTGTITAVNTDTTPPAVRCCLIGRASTAAGRIVNLDTYGVVYQRSGILWRQTMDTGSPGDSPPANITLFTRTSGGLYFWDGVRHSLVEQTPEEQPFGVFLRGFVALFGDDILNCEPSLVSVYESAANEL